MEIILFKNGYIAGAIAIKNSDTQAEFTELDLDILTFIAQHVVSGINRLQDVDILNKAVSARTFELMQHIRDREKSDLLQESLFKISELTSDTSLDLSEFYSKVHNFYYGSLLWY